MSAHFSAQGGQEFTSAGTVNVTMHHNHLSRDGLYIDPSFTRAAAAGLIRDLAFNGAVVGAVYAQPLYLDSGPNGAAAIIVVTESNNIYALNPTNGGIIWKTNAGLAVPESKLPCGDINPVGIVGTPVVDLPTRSLLFDSLTTRNGTIRHFIYSLSVDTGTVNSGWPVEVDAVASYQGMAFASDAQGQRGALTVVNGILYVPYGGYYGDCGTYHGWLIGVPLDDPTNVLAWATSANGGGCWGVGGVASDGTDVYIATGNTMGASEWSGGEAVIRFQPGPIFSQQTSDYWAPSNWQSLDSNDLDLGGSGPVLVNAPGATPSSLVMALGKDGNAYLLNRANLGGVGAPLVEDDSISSASIVQAAATYQTTQGTYVVCNIDGDNLSALLIGASSPPTISTLWTASVDGRGSPFVTSTDGTNDVIVWGVGCEGSQRLYGFDGDTGEVIFSGGGANELMANTRRFNTGIVAHGHIYFAADNQVYAFIVPAQPIVLGPPALSPDNVFQFSFTNIPGMSFTAFATTNVSLPFADWFQVGVVQEVSPGQYQFTDSQATTNPALFYQVRSP